MRALAVVVLLGTLTGCSSLCIRTPSDVPFLDITLPRGHSVQFTAGGPDILGECDRPGPSEVMWHSTDPTVAAIDSNGTARGLQPGTATIVARAGWNKATWAITVVPPIARLVIQPRDTTIATRDTVWFKAVALDSAGNVIPKARIALRLATTHPAGIHTVSFFGQNAPRVPPNTLPVMSSRPAVGYVIAHLIGTRDSVRVSAVDH